MSKKIIVIIKGGLGNQLFCYATAKAMALSNQAILVIDKKTGFKKDYKYNRNYSLNHFNINEKILYSTDYLYQFYRIFYKLSSLINRILSFEKRYYIKQYSDDFDYSLLSKKVVKHLYLDGYWQSENYFIKHKSLILQDLKIIPPADRKNKETAERIMNINAICIHVRWFDNPKNHSLENNIGKDYYKRAIDYMIEKMDNCHFFIFSDFPEETKIYLNLPTSISTFINHNKGDDNAYADLWLMTLCKHFIIANSTFSWWGAWLSKNLQKIVIAPKEVKNGVGAWGFEGLLPDEWIKI